MSVPVLFFSNMFAGAKSSFCTELPSAQASARRVAGRGGRTKICAEKEVLTHVVLQVQKLKRANGELQREARALRERVGYLEGVLDARGVP